jgi:cyclase
MLKTRVIPVLLLKNGGLVKTIRFKDPTYIGDPINAVKIFNEKEVDELVFLDISATKEKRLPDLDKISQIANECFMPLCYGGGVTSVDQMKEIFGLGVEKISINNAACSNPALVKEAADIFGSQSVIVSIDVKKNIFGKYEIVVAGGAKGTGMDPVDWAKRVQDLGAGEILLNSVNCDGMMNGYDIDMIKKICQAVSVPVIVCGGAGKAEDFRQAQDAGASAVAAGSMFVFFGKNRAVLINYPSPEELSSFLK